MDALALDPTALTATAIATAVRHGKLTARQVAQAHLLRIARLNRQLGAFTDITAARALAEADAVDARRAAGAPLGQLAGVPFAVKNLFDLQGLITRAGSKINLDQPPADSDAFLVRRLRAADAVCLGALNMGEYAYDFTGENAHVGPSRNPHALEHMSGGSSGGSGTAVAAGLTPVALGSDTNGSIRVPSSFCGIFGLKPTYGRLSRMGSFPFVASLDHLGPFARSVADLALAYDSMQGSDPSDGAQAARQIEPTQPSLGLGIDRLRLAVAGGYFRRGALPEAYEAVDRAAAALGVTRLVDIPDAALGRAAAYTITTAEGAQLHLSRLQSRADDFDPDVRDRLLAGAMVPAAFVIKAQKVRRWYREKVLRLFDQVDVILAPATPCRAPRIGQKTFVLDGQEMLVRPNIGIFTQPISAIGLPVVAVPLWTDGERLPLGVQVIAPPWREDLALRVAAALEAVGVARSPIASL